MRRGDGSATRPRLHRFARRQATELGISDEEMTAEMADASHRKRQEPVIDATAVDKRLERVRAGVRHEDHEVVESERADLYRDLLQSIAEGRA